MFTKREIWLQHYLNKDNKDTYFKAGPSARAAGYQCSDETGFYAIGSMNKKHWEERIQKWLNDEGLGEIALKSKLLKLLDAKKTMFFTHMGEVTDQRTVDALDTQIKALHMALKAKGEYAPEKRELSGPGGGPIATASITSEMSPKEAATLYQRMIKGE